MFVCGWIHECKREIIMCLHGWKKSGRNFSTLQRDARVSDSMDGLISLLGRRVVQFVEKSWAGNQSRCLVYVNCWLAGCVWEFACHLPGERKSGATWLHIFVVEKVVDFYAQFAKKRCTFQQKLSDWIEFVKSDAFLINLSNNWIPVR